MQTFLLSLTIKKMNFKKSKINKLRGITFGFGKQMVVDFKTS